MPFPGRGVSVLRDRGGSSSNPCVRYSYHEGELVGESVGGLVGERVEGEKYGVSGLEHVKSSIR